LRTPEIDFDPGRYEREIDWPGSFGRSYSRCRLP
jgi:hypothetical protein